MTLAQYLCLTFDCYTFESKINFLKEIGEDTMSLMFEGHTFEEMVEAIHENEDLKIEIVDLKDKIEELEEELSSKKNLIRVQKEYIVMKNEKIEQLKEDLGFLEEAHDNLLVKYDEMVSSILDIVCDSANM